MKKIKIGCHRCFIICLIYTTNVAQTSQSQLGNEMDLTDDQFDALIGNSSSIDYGSVFQNMDFRWKNGTIPYQFNSNQEFNEAFKKNITDAISFINDNLKDCISLRYVPKFYLN